jgi:hypothetical protein
MTARGLFATIGWPLLIVMGCGGETDAGGAGGSTSGGSGGSTSGGSGGSTSGGSGGAAGSGGGSGAVGSVVCGGISEPDKECAPEEYCCGSKCTKDDTPCTGYAFHCDDAADCPGAICCVTKLSMLDGSFNQVAECQSSCDADTQLIVCHYPGGCPAGMTCQITATLPPQYGYCCPSGQPCSAT